MFIIIFDSGHSKNDHYWGAVNKYTREPWNVFHDGCRMATDFWYVWTTKELADAAIFKTKHNDFLDTIECVKNNTHSICEYHTKSIHVPWIPGSGEEK